MKAITDNDPKEKLAADDQDLAAFLAKPVAANAAASIVIGELVGMHGDDGRPLVTIPGHGAAAVPARSTVNLHGGHVGRQVALHFEGGDHSKPIVTGVLRADDAWPLASSAEPVQIETDGERVTVSAKDRLVLRCGKASVTLTKEGKLLIEGTYVSSHSTGVNRIRGGSVQIN